MFDSIQSQKIDETVAGSPLATPGDAFRLGPPSWWWEGAGDAPSSDSAVRPFSLRGVQEGARMDAHQPYSYEYDPVTQTAVARDEHGREVALAKHTRPGVTPSRGTSAVPDGDPENPPPEEMHPADQQSD